MINNWMKYAGAVFGIFLTLSFVPATADANEADNENQVKLEVNVLNDEEDKASLLDVEINNVPLVEDVHIKVPAEHADDSKSVAEVSIEEGILGETEAKVLTQQESKTSSNSALVDVSVEDSIVDDAKVEVLHKENEGKASSSEGAVSVNVDNILLEEVEADVIYNENAGTEESTERSEGVVHVEGKDTPVVEDTHIGVLDHHEQTAIEGNEVTSSLANVELDNGLADELTVSVLEDSYSETENTIHQNDSAASVTLDTPLTDDIDADVLLAEETMTGDDYAFDAGVVELTTEDLPIVGESHIGLLDEHVFVTDEIYTLEKGAVQVGLDEVPVIGNTRIGVLDYHEQLTDTGTEETGSLANVNLDNGLVDELNVSVLEDSYSETEDALHQNDSVASITLDTLLTNDIDLAVLLAEGLLTNEGYTYETGVIELTAGNLPIIGESHISVLDERFLGNKINEGGMPKNKISLAVGDLLRADVQLGILPIGSLLRGAALTPPVGDEDGEIPADSPNENGMSNDSNAGAENPGDNGISDEIPDSSDNVNDDGSGNLPGKNETPGGSSPDQNTDDHASENQRQALAKNDAKSTIGDNFIAQLHKSMAGGDHSAEGTGMLPKTGGFLDSLMLIILALGLLTGGIAMRRFAV